MVLCQRQNDSIAAKQPNRIYPMSHPYVAIALVGVLFAFLSAMAVCCVFSSMETRDKWIGFGLISFSTLFPCGLMALCVLH